MRRIVKWAGGVLALAVLVVVAAVGIGHWKVTQGGKRVYAVSDPPLAALPRDPAVLAHGAHVYATRGCADCHGKDASGALAFDAGPVGIVHGPNLTRGGRLAGRTPDEVAVAIRHGLRADGTALLIMPSEDFHQMADADVAAVIAWLDALPASPKPSGPVTIRPLGSLLYAAGKLPLYPAEHIDHAPRARPLPAVAASVEYGRYLAQGCIGCHGRNFAGQHVPGTPPEFPDARNITPHGIGGWTTANFRAAMRQGKRPDGSDIHPFMPWKSFAGMTDVEVDALHAYLRTVPPVAQP